MLERPRLTGVQRFGSVIVALIMLLISGAPAAARIVSDEHVGTKNQDLQEFRFCDVAKGLDLILLIDQSRSLIEDSNGKTLASNDEDAGLSKLRSGLEALTPIFEMGGDKINLGVIGFSGNAEIVRSLGAGALKQSEYPLIIDRLTNPESLRGDTNYLEATDLAITEFNQHASDSRCRSLIWFTDGVVNLPNINDQAIEGNRLLDQFCGSGPSNSQSTAKKLRDLEIRPYVILLLPEDYFPKQKPNSEKSPEEFAKWASITALRGFTGDWGTPEGGSDSENKPAESGTSCDVFSGPKLGRLWPVTQVSELERLLIKALTSCEGNETKEFNSLPAGKLMKNLLIIFENKEGKNSFADLAPVLEPVELSGKISEGRPFVRFTNSELADLPAGWKLKLKNEVGDFCIKFDLQWTGEYQLNAIPKVNEIRPDSGTDLTVDLVIPPASLITGLKIGRVGNSPNNPLVSDDGLSITFRADIGQKKIVKVPGLFEAIPTGVIPGSEGWELIKQWPLLVSVSLTPGVEVIGVENIPRVDCGQEEKSLKVSLIGEDVPSKAIPSQNSCTVTNFEKGSITVRFVEPLRATDQNSWGLFSRSQDTPAQIGEKITFDSKNLSVPEFGIISTNSFPDQNIEYRSNGSIEVLWTYNDLKDVSIAIVDAEVILSLKARSNASWAFLVAVLVAIFSSLASYLILVFVLKSTAMLGRPSDFLYLETAGTVTAKDGNEPVWVERNSFEPSSTDLKRASGDDSQRKRISFGEVTLMTATAPFWQMRKVLRGPWARIEAKGKTAAYPKGSENSSTLAPLRSSVVVRHTGGNASEGSIRVAFVFLVPTSGGQRGVSGVKQLMSQTNRISSELFRSLLKQEDTPAFSRLDKGQRPEKSDQQNDSKVRKTTVDQDAPNSGPNPEKLPPPRRLGEAPLGGVRGPSSSPPNRTNLPPGSKRSEPPRN
jgi:hypothetical protein